MKKIFILAVSVINIMIMSSCSAENTVLLGFNGNKMVIKKPNGKVVYVDKKSNPFLRGFKK